MKRLQRSSTDHCRALALLVVTVAMWSISGGLIKNVDASPIAISGIRSAVAFVVMLPFIRRSDLTFSAVQMAGAVFYAINMLVFVASTTLTTAANAHLCVHRPKKSRKMPTAEPNKGCRDSEICRKVCKFVQKQLQESTELIE